MSKSELHSAPFAGGGRVLSLILAGTLAMGLTPGMTLTSQSLHPMQAYAEEESLPTAMVTLSGEGITASENGGYEMTFNGQVVTPEVKVVVGSQEVPASDVELTIISLSEGHPDGELGLALEYRITVAPTASASTQFAPVYVPFEIKPKEVGFEIDAESIFSSIPLDDSTASSVIKRHVSFTDTIENDPWLWGKPLEPYIWVRSITDSPDGKTQTVEFSVDASTINYRAKNQDPQTITVNITDDAAQSEVHTTDDGFTYIIDNDNAMLLGYSGAGGDVAIPSTVGEQGCPVREIRNDLFSGNQTVNKVTISEGIESSWVALFRNSSIKTFEILSDEFSYNGDLFMDCPQLENIIVSEDNARYAVVNGNLFSEDGTKLNYYIGREAETTYTIPSDVRYIGSCAFANTKHLQTLIIPDAVKGLDGHHIFAGSSIQTINIGKGLEDSWSLGRDGFGSGLQEIYVDPNNETLSSDSGALYTKDKSELIAYPAAKDDTKYIALPTVTSVRGGAFSYSANLSEIVFPSKIDNLTSWYYEIPERIPDRVVFRNGVNANKISYMPNFGWGPSDARTVFIGDDSVRQVIEKSRNYGLTVEDSYLNSDLSSMRLVVADQTYTGSPVEPTITLEGEGAVSVLQKGTDYEVVYENNINPGTATVTVVATESGEFHGETSATFEITGTVPDNPPTPVNPVVPEDPIDPIEPVDPVDPVNPTDPEEPENPDEPTDPENPDTPDTPDVPVDPEEPTDPEEPDVPQEPETPEVPEEPEPAPEPEGTWVKDKTGWWLKNDDGTYPKDTWKEVGGTWYHFDDSGYMETGWIKQGSTWYYLKDSGAMATGWQKVNGSWYHMDSQGHMQTGWQEVDGKWYYLNKSGAMQTGWIQQGGTWYYANESGAMATGWSKVGGSWYHMDQDGRMQTGWQEIDGQWYYMNTSGAMQTGWIQQGNTWYYANQAGVMTTGWQKVGGSWYHMDDKGHMQTGWQEIDGEWYYFTESGIMATNTAVDGGRYQIGADGRWVK